MLNNNLLHIKAIVCRPRPGPISCQSYGHNIYINYILNALAKHCIIHAKCVEYELSCGPTCSIMDSAIMESNIR